MFTLPDIALGATLASLVAGFVSWLGLVISKEHKVSDFRQAWVDALRADTAALVADYHRHARLRTRQDDRQRDALEDALRAVRSTEAAIRLRLNPDHTTSLKVFGCLDRLNELIRTGNLGDEVVSDATAALVAATQPILKEGWERVKRGEWWFRGTKVAAATLVLVALGSLLVAHLAS